MQLQFHIFSNVKYYSLQGRAVSAFDKDPKLATLFNTVVYIIIISQYL
jgi:hypothetical protein